MPFKRYFFIATLVGISSLAYSLTRADSAPTLPEPTPEATSSIPAIITVVPTTLVSETSHEIEPDELPTNPAVAKPAVTSTTKPRKRKSAEITEKLIATADIPEPSPAPAPKPTVAKEMSSSAEVFTVPFYSQFQDITAPQWKKIGCGIASLAMLIEFYEPGKVTVDTLLAEGIAADAYLSNAGWIHSGLIGLSKKYGLTGSSKDLAGSTMENAFAHLKSILTNGPVMVSVHYTFDPKNPIPHLVVVNGVSDGKVFYNDPSEKSGGGSISITQFQSAWKKRYIEIRPIS